MSRQNRIYLVGGRVVTPTGMLVATVEIADGRVARVGDFSSRARR